MYLNAPTILPAEARDQVGSILNHGLADEFALSAATRDYHWNVSGPQSRSLYELFGEQYRDLNQWIEKIADRARTIGVVAQAGWSELIKAPRFTPAAGAGLSGRGMLVSLADIHQLMVEQLRADANACAQDFGDPLTAELLEELLEYHESTAWMLRELLDDSDLAEAV